MPKVPYYEPQKSLMVPPAHMPFASLDTLSGPAEAMGKMGAVGQQIANTFAEVASHKRQVDNADAIYGGLTEFSAELHSLAQQAGDFDSFKAASTELLNGYRAKMPNGTARALFDQKAGYLHITRLGEVQNRLFQEDIRDKREAVLSRMHKSVMEISSDPTSGRAYEKQALINQELDAQVASKLFRPEEALKIKEHMAQQLWSTVVYRGAKENPVEMHRRLMAKEFDDKLSPDKINFFLEKTSAMANREDALMRREVRLQEQLQKLEDTHLYYQMKEQIWDQKRWTNNNLYKVIAQIRASGLPPDKVFQLTKDVDIIMGGQIKQGERELARILNIPEEVFSFIAKNQKVPDAHIAVSQRFSLYQNRFVNRVKAGTPVPIALQLVQEELKSQRIVGGEDVYTAPEGFQGDANDDAALKQYILDTDTARGKHLIDPDVAEMKIAQAKNRLKYNEAMRKGASPGVPPQSGPLAPKPDTTKGGMRKSSWRQPQTRQPFVPGQMDPFAQ